MARKKTFEERYPDLQEHGGLRGLLVHLSKQLDRPLPFDADDDRVESERRFSQISVALYERLFMLDLWQDGVVLGNGVTKEPENLILAIHRFIVEEASPIELSQEFPFVKPSDGAVAYLEGPQSFVKRQWENLEEWLRDDPHMNLLYPVCIAARCHPHLSQLFPFTSMWSLCFSRCTGYPFDVPCPDIQPVRNGNPYIQPVRNDNPSQRYTVGNWSMDGKNVLFEGDAAEVVEFVAAQLPPNCGPARHGTAEDNQ